MSDSLLHLGRRLRSLLATLSAAVLLTMMFIRPAAALPSFARQTGEECAACHIGGFGPQLTPHGMKFKLSGYTDGKAPAWYLPLSGQAIASYTETQKSQAGGAAPHFSSNGNSELQEASLFLAGKISDFAGVFAQYTYSGTDHTASWDQLDLRVAKTFSLAGRDTIVGLSLNNNPGIQDFANTQAVWSFPYTGSDLTPGYLGTPIIDEGLGQQTLGLSAYLDWNEWIYLEAGAYRGLPGSFLDNVGVKSDQLLIKGPSPYWRLAVKHSFNHQFASFGVFGLNTALQADPASPVRDYFHDVGIDGSYQFLGTRKHVLTANARYTHENQRLDASYGAGAAANRNNTLEEFTLNASYYYLNTYGVTAGFFNTYGSGDIGLYNADSSAAAGKPDTRGTTLQIDYTPWGKEDSWLAPWANLRLGLQYTAYTEFNGAGANYDGNGRNASDNNTLFAFLWLAF